MGVTHVQVGRRRTSDGPKQVTQHGQMPSRLGDAIEEDDTVPQPDHPADRLESHSQSLASRKRGADLNENENVFARQLADAAGESQKYAWPIEDLMKIALSAYGAEIVGVRRDP